MSIPRHPAPCSTPGCEKPSRALKLCVAHYAVQRRAARGARSRPLGDDPKARLAARYDVDPSGCWLWTWGKDQDGYGVTHFGGARVKAHRLSYETYVGPIPEGLTIDHLCRVTSCVNPDHLEPVTNAENVRRARAMHGASTPPGSDRPTQAIEQRG